MKIESQEDLIKFIQQEQNIDNIKMVFEKCINSKVLFTWNDEGIEVFKSRLIDFINDYGSLDITNRPIFVGPF